MKISRRKALAAFGTLVGSASLWNPASWGTTMNWGSEGTVKGRINQSVCKWCYNDIPLDEFCQAVKKIGIQSVELLGPQDWDTLKKHGLTCAMPSGAGLGITKGFNDPAFHNELVESYKSVIPMVAEAGFDKIICFSGNRNGMDDKSGLEHCMQGIKRIMKTAEEHEVTVCMELLNSKVNHPDYQCDKTAWGVALCDQIGSEHFKLLYDIYHMQIMEGDVIRTIWDYHEYFAHYHTGGVPGRNEIDESQELYYPAIMEAILETGYTGFVGQEFIPSREDELAALESGFNICDV